MHQLPLLRAPIRYRRDILMTLRELGIVPRPVTQPRTVYELLRALMTFEIRDCKSRRRELERVFGPQPLDDYARRIEELRAKYALLRTPLEEWVDAAGRGQGETPSGS